MTGFAADSARGVAAPDSHSTASVTIRDRSVLPFFQVRLRAVRAIRERGSGPRRVRAIGLYACLCLLANEQRHVGDHERVQIDYRTLAARWHIGARSIAALLTMLLDAGAIRVERIADPRRGAAITEVHLVVQEPPWVPVTVAMAERLGTGRAGGHALRDLGLAVVLLELCGEQRRERGGLEAETTRADLATRAGLGVDRVDACVRALELAGVLEVTRRRPARGGATSPACTR
jgi:hypothetical protein